MNFAATLQRLAVELDRLDCRVALIGGHALAAYGIVRATLDLDLLAEASSQDAVLDLMQQLGYEELHSSTGYSNHQHPDSRKGRVDFVYVGERTAKQVFDGGVQLEGPGGIPVLVPRPEHLASMKALAIKNDHSRARQELADVDALLRLPDVNRDEVREFFARHGLLRYWGELSGTDPVD